MSTDEDAPRVGPKDWVTVSGRDAVVSSVISADEIEVIYEDRGRAIYEPAVWAGGSWVFKSPGPSGGHANGKQRLEPFVRQLRGGRWVK